MENKTEESQAKKVSETDLDYAKLKRMFAPIDPKNIVREMVSDWKKTTNTSESRVAVYSHESDGKKNYLSVLENAKLGEKSKLYLNANFQFPDPETALNAGFAMASQIPSPYTKLSDTDVKEIVGEINKRLGEIGINVSKIDPEKIDAVAKDMLADHMGYKFSKDELTKIPNLERTIISKEADLLKRLNGMELSQAAFEKEKEGIANFKTTASLENSKSIAKASQVLDMIGVDTKKLTNSAKIEFGNEITSKNLEADITIKKTLPTLSLKAFPSLKKSITSKGVDLDLD